MASATVTEATLYDVDMPQHQLDQRHADAPEVVDDHLQAEASTTGQEEDEDRQSYPLGQSHTPLTSIPTLGQALIDGNNLDRKYVHSFLQVLADHSQFSDKYQHYEEDEYERKRKRKLRESERKMFFYAGQSANGGGSGDKSKRKAAASVDKGGSSGGASVSNKKRRRKERERERERVLDKDARRQLSGSAPMMMSMAGQRSQSSSPFNSPPTIAGTPSAERTGSMPNMPNMPQWSAAQNDRNASFYSASVPSAMPSHAQDMTGLHHQPHHHPHQVLSSVQAASHLMRHRASMPQLPTQQHQYLQRPGGYLHLSAGHYSPSSSFDYMPQQSPLSSSLSSSASSSVYYTSPAPSPSPASHIVPIRANDYAPSPPTYHHPQHRQVAMQQSSYASYYQRQPLQRYPHQQALLATSLPAEIMLDAYGGHLTAEEQPNDATLDDESWTSSSISASSSGELSSGSESFSCFGPFDPAAIGGATAGDDGEDLACADMASAAAAAVESFMLANQHQQHLKEESSPEGAQQQAGGGVAVDEDWFNSFFSDTVGSPLLGGQTGDVPDGAQCYPALDSSHIDSLFADVEAYYGRLVN